MNNPNLTFQIKEVLDSFLDIPNSDNKNSVYDLEWWIKSVTFPT